MPVGETLPQQLGVENRGARKNGDLEERLEPR